MADAATILGDKAETLAQAFLETAAERAAIQDPQHITVDVPSAVTTTYGALPAIMRLKPEIEATFKTFEVRYIDNLERYASGALYAHTRWLFSTEPSVPLQQLIADAMKQRGLFVAVLETASIYGLIPADILLDLQGAKGHKNMAVDLIGVTGVLRQYWSALEGKTPVSVADLEHAEQLGQQLVKALGAREQAPAADGAAAMDRKRAFTLLAVAYGEVRDAVLYVRRNSGDADQIAPSFYAGRGGSKKKESTESAEAKPEPTTVAPTNGAATAPAVPVGHPDSSPFAAT